MPAVPPGQPIAPGISAGNSGYPQWGVKQSGSTYTVKEAATAADKTADISGGYLTWFTTDAAAKGFVSSETSLLNGKIPNPLPGWSLQFGNTTHLLTRILKVAIGGFLLLAGIMKLTNTDKAVLGIAGQAAGRLPGI